jgi:hypothetical protein
MTRRPIFVAASGIAIAAMLLAANMVSAQQVPPTQRSPQLQQPTVRQTRPIVGGWKLQPHESQLQDLGVQAPSREQIQEMDRLMRQLLDDSRRASGSGNRP